MSAAAMHFSASAARRPRVVDLAAASDSVSGGGLMSEGAMHFGASSACRPPVVDLDAESDSSSGEEEQDAAASLHVRARRSLDFKDDPDVTATGRPRDASAAARAAMARAAEAGAAAQQICSEYWTVHDAQATHKRHADRNCRTVRGKALTNAPPHGDRHPLCGVCCK